VNYAGIGSRETPEDVLIAFERIGEFLAKKGHTLRSGGAKGADSAFERGCDKAQGKKEIFLPWANFENNKSQLIINGEEIYKIAEKYHPKWGSVSQGARKLLARNGYQILGWDLKTPSDFIICWTPHGLMGGGTGQALRLAKDYNIPIFDFGLYEDITIGKEKFNEFSKNRITNN
jgi:hypothetical protein